MQKNRYTIPGQTDRVVFSQSWLSSYYECPMKFALAYENKVSWDSEAVRKGNIFERLVLGDFDNKLSEYQYRSGKTKDMLHRCATSFIEGHTTSTISPLNVQKEIITDVGNYGLGGVIDYLGCLTDDEESINDLKFSENPMRSTFYNPLNEDAPGIKELLQPIVYTYLVHKETGKILPFKRIVVSPLGDGANVWIKTFKVGQGSFDWLESQLDTIYTQWSIGFNPATEDHEQCYHRRNGACKYLQFCDTGLKRIFSNDTIDVDSFLGVKELTY